MNFLFVFIAVAIVIGLLVALKTKQTKRYDGLAFVGRDALFTLAERSFLGVLEQALDDRYRVFGKVRLGDIVKPAKGLSNSKRATAQNRINQKHVDFVICKAVDLAVAGVVELDDKSHERDDRVERDELVNQALAMAKIPVIHFPARKGYAVQEVRTTLEEILPAGAIVPTQATPAATTECAPLQSEPSCPKCGTVMVKRQAGKGEHAGKWFWACNAFPKCRQVVAIGEN